MIIDTETHVMRFARSHYNNPGNNQSSMIKHYTWHEHPSDLLVAEMDAAGVNKTFLISYDTEDISWSAQEKGYTVEDFSGGRKHTLKEIRKHPDRFLWFNTLKDPRQHDAIAMVKRDTPLGMVGIKLFPGFINVSLLDEGIREVFNLCQELDLRVLISFEMLRPPRTKSLSEYLSELAQILGLYPDVRFALLHIGCADPLTSDAEQVFELTREHANLYLSTAYPGEVWDDGTEYPFRNYLKRVQITCAAVGAERVMWASDWPWFDWAFKYQQGVDCIRKHAVFLTESEKQLVLGGTAVEFLGTRLNTEVSM